MPDTPITPERLQEIEERLAIAERLKSVASDEPDWYLYDVLPLVAALRAEREENKRLRDAVRVAIPWVKQAAGIRIGATADPATVLALLEAALRGEQP